MKEKEIKKFIKKKKIQKHKEEKNFVKNKYIQFFNNMKKFKISIILFLAFISFFLFSSFFTIKKIFSNPKMFSKPSKIKRVGVVNLPISQNIGNFLVKFAMFKKLEELGFNATIIAPNKKIDPLEVNRTFLDRTINSHLLITNENFSDIKENDYDYLMVSSDQTWAFYNSKFFYNVALLKFAEKWNVKKFIYAASTGRYNWFFKKSDEALFQHLLTNFTGISFREKGMVKLLKEHLDLKSEFVLDPTLLLDKQYYLNEIKNFTSKFSPEEKFIFVYQLDNKFVITKTIRDACEKFNFKVYKLNLSRSDLVESFIYGINNSQAVIADSFHGTVFAIMFNKPFISFSNLNRGKARFDSLKEVFHLRNRIIEPFRYAKIDINLLLEPPNINQTLFNEIRNFSINYLKKNLDMV